jgi:hypothetical protein
MDKRTQSDAEHAFIEFIDKITELGFKFDMFTKIELTYVKGDAADSPHSMHNKLNLRAEDFLPNENVKDADDF